MSAFYVNAVFNETETPLQIQNVFLVLLLSNVPPTFHSLCFSQDGRIIIIRVLVTMIY